MLSIDGLVTGIDTGTVIEGLLEIRQSQIERFQVRRAEAVGKQASFSGIEAQLLSLRTEINRLSSTRNNALNARTVAVSNEDILSAAAGSSAATGVYELRVAQLATAHQYASEIVDSPDQEITTGSLFVRVGSGENVEIEIDGTNNTIQGLADTINSSDAEVSASIVSTGSGFQMLLTADKSGAENQIAIQNNLAAGAGEAIQFDVQAATLQLGQDAEIYFGSGEILEEGETADPNVPTPIKIVSASNEIDGVIEGVTLNLLNADVGETVTLNITRDKESAKVALQEFVSAYNQVMSYIDEQSRFDAATETAGPLLGDRNVIAVQDQIRLAATSLIGGVNKDLNRLSAIGIEVTNTGKLSVNSGRMDDVFAGRVAGVTVDDAIRLFATTGVSDSSGISFSLATAKTKEGEVEIEVTAAALRGYTVAGTELADSTVIDATNNGFKLTIDGRESKEIELAEGTYGRDELAAEIQRVLDADTNLRGREVTVSVQDNKLYLRSEAFGSSSFITDFEGTSLATLGLDTTDEHRGRDVVGKFIVNGVEEETIGTGQFLSGKSGNANTDGLQVRISLTDSQVASLTENPKLEVTRGIASRIESALNELLRDEGKDAETGIDRKGIVGTTNDRYKEIVSDIDESIQRLNERFDREQEELARQFAALESTVSQLQTAGNFLSAQLLNSSSLSG
ncbi:MAG: flagellar filament capping protein FliD [Planctomycetales bacterium]|nr:flagellar filament capping protein FliD [Planctomycetales bacterium]